MPHKHKLGEVLRAVERDQPRGRDQLSTLPYEILALIFEQVRLSSNAPMKGIICRLLLPFTRQHFYEKVEINTSYRLCRLVSTILSLQDAGVGAFIKHLDIDVDRYFKSIEAEAAYVWMPTGREIVAFFATLTNLEVLCIEGRKTASVARALLLGCTRGSLLKMKSLRLDESLDGWTEPFQYHYFANLSRYRQLEELTIVHGYEVGDVVGKSELGSFRKAPNTSIKKITMEGFLAGVDRAQVAHFLRQFTSLESLTIAPVTDFDFFSLPIIGNNLPHMTVFDMGYRLEDRGDGTIDPGVPHLPSLRTLELRPDTFAPSSYISLLGGSSMKTLTFPESGHVSWGGLVEILDSAWLVPELRRLDINVKEPGKMGRQLSDQEALALDGENISAEGGWLEPVWSDSFDIRHVMTVELSKARVPFEVTGNVFEAKDVDIAHSQEVDRVQRVRATYGLDPVWVL